MPKKTRKSSKKRGRHGPRVETSDPRDPQELGEMPIDDKESQDPGRQEQLSDQSPPSPDTNAEKKARKKKKSHKKGRSKKKSRRSKAVPKLQHPSEGVKEQDPAPEAEVRAEIRELDNDLRTLHELEELASTKDLQAEAQNKRSRFMEEAAFERSAVNAVDENGGLTKMPDKGQRIVLTSGTSSERGLSSREDMGHIFPQNPWGMPAGSSWDAGEVKISVQYQQSSTENADFAEEYQKPSDLTLVRSSNCDLLGLAGIAQMSQASSWEGRTADKSSVQRYKTSMRKHESVGVDSRDPENTVSMTPEVSSTRGLPTSADMSHIFPSPPWVVQPEESIKPQPVSSTHYPFEMDSTITKSEERPVLLRGMDDIAMERKQPLRPRVLRYLALASVSCLALVLLLIPVFFKISSRQPKAFRSMCTDDECHRSTSHITSFANKSIDACDNFYERVCYRWTRLNASVGFVEGAVTSFYDRLTKKVLTTATANPDREGTHVFQRLFQSCSHFMKTTHSVRELISKVTRHFIGKLPKPSSSWEAAMAFAVNLTMLHGIGTAFEIGWESGTSRNYFVLSRGKSVLEKFGAPTYKALYVDYVSEAVHQLLDSSSKDVVNAVLSLDETVTKIISSRPHIREIYASFRVVERISKNLTASFWLHAINQHLPLASKVAPSDMILTTGFDALKQVMSVIESSPTTIANVYINMLVVAEVLRFDYHGNISTQSNDFMKVCLRATQRVLTQTWPTVISTVSGYGNHVVSDQLDDLFRQAKTGFLEELRFSKWMDPESHIAVHHKLLRSKAYTFSEKDTFPEAVEYLSLDLRGRDFVSGYLAALAHEARVLRRATPRLEECVFFNAVQLEGTVYFDDRDYILVLPTPYLAAPLFDSFDGEQFHNFATVGTISAAFLARAVSSPKSSHPPSAESLRALKAGTECFRNQFESRFVNSKVPEDLGNSVFVWTAAVRAAYEKLKKYSEEHLSANEMQTYWTRIQQQFFEGYCLLSCTTRAGSDVLSPLQRCVIPLQNMQEFAVAHSCVNGSRMNPSFKCPQL
ncbi:neprilysin-1-like [Ornithodoros turicata]|uniref:neprilysin-1-like n=1 Tax=Ornithodoros turicata TaxID=34597 RepID=UPI0031389F12